MLVLSRRLNEQIRIGENVTVKVLSVCDGKVKLGIVAPLDVRVDREEVAKAKICQGENTHA